MQHGPAATSSSTNSHLSHRKKSQKHHFDKLLTHTHPSGRMPSDDAVFLGVAICDRSMAAKNKMIIWRVVPVMEQVCLYVERSGKSVPTRIVLSNCGDAKQIGESQKMLQPLPGLTQHFGLRTLETVGTHHFTKNRNLEIGSTIFMVWVCSWNKCDAARHHKLNRPYGDVNLSTSSHPSHRFSYKEHTPKKT